jgi:hypothetical protein
MNQQQPNSHAYSYHRDSQGRRPPNRLGLHLQPDYQSAKVE